MGTNSESILKKNLVSQINKESAFEQYQKAGEDLKKLADIAGEDDAEYILAYNYLQRSQLVKNDIS